MSQTAFGRYIKKMREASRLSLREVTLRMGNVISHVFLGEVERGIRKSLKREHWPKLIEAIPGITMQDLEDQMTKMQYNLDDAPLEYQSLGIELARRLDNQNLSEEQIRKLREILSED